MTMFNTARVWIQLHIYQANLVNFMTTQKLLKDSKVTFEWTDGVLLLAVIGYGEIL